MPGKLARVWRRQDAFLAPQDYQHPLLAKFRTVAGGVPWDAFNVWSHWQLSDLANGVNTVIAYSNGQAALLERSVGKGRVLVVHDANFRRFNGIGPVELAAAGKRAVAVRDAFERNAVVLGRQRRGDD